MQRLTVLKIEMKDDSEKPGNALDAEDFVHASIWVPYPLSGARKRAVGAFRPNMLACWKNPRALSFWLRSRISCNQTVFSTLMAPGTRT